MTTTYQLVVILNALFFLYYGYQSLNSYAMLEEFKRFGLTDNQRKLTGTLQMLGGVGLLVSFLYPFIGLLAAAGFTVMMFVAFMVRLKIKDSIANSLPSLFFMLINAWLTFAFYNIL